MRLSFRVLALLFALSMCSTYTRCQEVTGSIVGTVKDQSGAVVSGATVRLTNTDTNVVVRTVTTESNGDYSAPLLPIGHYTVAVEAPGFKKAVQTGIELNVNSKLTISPTLELGQAQETVTVEASPLQVELQSATASGLISGTQIRELSLNNRNYTQLVALMPGVSSTQADQAYVGLTNPLSGGFNLLGLSINGQRASANNWTVDGADNVDRGSNFGLLTTPSVDSIAEVKVLRSNYNAEFGRSAAGQVNVITRSGGSTFHGGAYEFFRNDVLTANTVLNKARKVPTPRPPLRYNNFGWTLGGPVYIPGIYNTSKDKTFFFFSQEFRRVTTYSSFFASVPTADELKGTFTNDVCIKFNADNTCKTYGKQVTDFSPTAQAYVKDIYSKTRLATDATHQVFNRFRTMSNFRQEAAKIDHVFGPRLSFYGRYLHDSIPTVEPLGLFSFTPLPGVGETASNAPGWSAVARATATLTPTWLLEGGYNYSYGAIVSTVTGLLNPANSPDIKVNLPFKATPGRLPSLSFTGPPSDIGSFGPYQDYNRNHQVYGNLTKISGRHTMKFGATYYHYQKTENSGGNAGSFTFDTSGAKFPTGVNPDVINFQQNFANFLQGRALRFSQASQDLFPDVRANQIEIFGQDQFRIRPKFTLSYGVRYSIFRQPSDASGKLTNFDPGLYDPAKAPCISNAGLIDNADPKCSRSTTFDRLNGIAIAGKNSPFGSKVANEDNKNFAPRIGIAWDPWNRGKTSVRAGYGIFYDASLFGTVEQNIFVNPPYVQSVTINNTLFDDPTAGSRVISAAPPTIYSRVPTPNHTPYTQTWSLDVQQEVAKGFLVDVGYYGSKGTHLLGAIDINQPRVGDYIKAGIGTADSGITGTDTVKLNRIRPFLGYGPINAIRNQFNSNYHSLQASAEKRLTGNSFMAFAYTWSKSLTDNQSDRSTAPQNSYDIRAEYGPSPQDRTHIFTANYVYELPFFKSQQGLIGHLAGGWEISGIVTLQSGTPLTVFGFRGARIDRAGQACLGASPCSVRPDMVADPNKGAPHTFDQWFNTSAFVDVPKGQARPGTAPRGAVRGPGHQRWDFSLFKNIKFTERLHAQFRAEAFNVFNHTNPLAIGTTLGTFNYGKVISTRDPRIMQLGLKVNF